MGRVAFWLLWWAASFVLWLLLTFNPVFEELIVGAGASALAATAVSLVRSQGLLNFRPRPSWFLRVRHLLGEVLRDTVVVTVALYRRVVRRDEVLGVWRSIPMKWGGDDARSAARRALIVAAIAVAPNTYAVGIDEHKDLMLIHQLVPSKRERTAEEVTGRL